MPRDECTARGRGLKCNVPLAHFSVRKHAKLKVNLTVQGQHFGSVFIQVYVRIYTHCYSVRLFLNIKCTFEEYSIQFSSLF
jgi:hypothetical protein